MKIKLAAIEELFKAPTAKYVVVTAITPTPLGEGKTTTTVGLGQGFKHIGKRAVVTIRQPSMGPTFGITGARHRRLQPGGADGGAQPAPDRRHARGHRRAQHAVRDGWTTTKTGQPVWPRCNITGAGCDVNDRALRNIVIGLGSRLRRSTEADRFRHHSRF
jgi:formate--tetrahydrofolate ligase